MQLPALSLQPRVSAALETALLWRELEGESVWEPTILDRTILQSADPFPVETVY